MTPEELALDGPDFAWRRLKGPDAPGCPEDYRAGYLAAVEELRATVDHWRPFGVKPVILKALAQVAETIGAGWECPEPGHGNERCRLRRAADVGSEGATRAQDGR